MLTYTPVLRDLWDGQTDGRLLGSPNTYTPLVEISANEQISSGDTSRDVLAER